MRSINGFWKNLFAQLPLSPRSNGVPIRRLTAAHVRAGNIARGNQDWHSAANAYREALAREPSLQHIWIQLGHMEKEAGEIDRATSAYQEAARLSDDAEPFLQLGHMAKTWSDSTTAAEHFVAALQRAPENIQAISELVRLLPDRDKAKSGLWNKAITVLGFDSAESSSQGSRFLKSGAIVFDVTDLISFFGQRRLPTGIQRVQIEIALACLEQSDRSLTTFCVYASGRRGWVKLSHDGFEKLCRLSKISDDNKESSWISRLKETYREIALSKNVDFRRNTLLINLGTSWSDRNFLLDVRTIRIQKGVIYVPLVFDLIPTISPQWFMQSLVHDYCAWFGSLLHSADGCLAISEATRNDLLLKSTEWNAPMQMLSVPVVRLNGDFRQPSAGKDCLSNYSLSPERYVLFVSTLEPRKNHRGAFNAWLMLAEKLGEAAMPRLVCVGGRGWLNEELHQMLRDHPSLRRMVVILHGIPDDVLAALYEHCLFVIYPSFYEGWGLPVSEALSYGKVPAVSTVSSLPEAGGPYACYFDPTNARDIASTVLALLDSDTRLDIESKIRDSYLPRSWQQIAADAIAKARNVGSREKDTLVRLAGSATWSFALPQQTDSFDRKTPAKNAEALRHGFAWMLPGLKGCRIDGDDATIRFYWSGLPNRKLEIHFLVTHGDGIVSITGYEICRELKIASDYPNSLTLPLPNIPGPFEIKLLPISGVIIVDKIVVADESL